MPQPAPRPSPSDPTGPTPPEAGSTPVPERGSTAPDSSSPSALFRALVDAGANAVVAYTADQQTCIMIESILDAKLQPLTAKLDRLLEDLDRRFEAVDRRFDAVDRKLAEHDRKLAVLAAQMRLVFGGLGLLVTVLIAVFGFLFTR